MPSFNDGPPQREAWNADVLSEALKRCAWRWVPELFPQGKIVNEKSGKAIRCADISGRPPRNKGSCVIECEGDKAGSWYDYSDKRGGQPLSTIREHFGYEHGDPRTFAMAAEICIEYGMGEFIRGEKSFDRPKPAANGNGHAANQYEPYIKDVLSIVKPIAGTPVETYWNARNLGPLPTSPDIGYHYSLTHRDTPGQGWPAIVCRYRYPWHPFDFTGGIHRSWLLQDGSWHITKQFPNLKAKLWIGNCDFGVIMLGWPGEAGELGVGEGIESAAAGGAYFNVPVWALGNDGGMSKLAETIRGGRLGVNLRRLLIFADRGKGGETNAHNLAAAALAAGIATELYLPRGDDDIAADRLAGLPPPEPSPIVPPAAGLLPLPAPAVPVNGPGSLESYLMALQPPLDGETINEAMRRIVNAKLNPALQDQAINLFCKHGKQGKAAVVKAIKQFEKNDHKVSAGRVSKPWEGKLAIGNDGEPKAIMSNATIILREAEELRACVGFNEFAGMLWVQRKFPWEKGYGNPCDRAWTDDDELALTEWMQAVAGVHIRKNDVFDAVRRVAAEYRFHPVTAYLHDLRWDGVPRIDYFSSTYLGAKPTRYNCEVGRRWLFSAVARVERPGTKADCMVVVEGPQGKKKSSAIRALFEPWFTDQLSEIGSKDSSLELRGIWCAEHSELDTMGRVDASRIKSFMSRQEDRFRPPYGRVPITEPRQNVFAGTSNDHEWNKDPTGGRRFWPIVCGTIDIDRLKADRDQLWAEALDRYLKGMAQWWIDDSDKELMSLVEEQVEARYQRDAWESVIEAWLHSSTVRMFVQGGQTFYGVNVPEILEKALAINDRTKWTRADQTRVGAIMRRLNWEKTRMSIFNQPADWFYVKPANKS
jgi:putative DNA primase/helicase